LIALIFKLEELNRADGARNHDQSGGLFEDQDCKEAARMMKNKGLRRLTVMDRQHVTVGILSVDDLARCSHDLAGEVLEAAAPWPH
jgi:Mg/Co/Ni transporter MgtE